jgi:hypothetical protein
VFFCDQETHIHGNTLLDSMTCKQMANVKEMTHLSSLVSSSLCFEIYAANKERLPGKRYSSCNADSIGSPFFFCPL